MKEKDLNMQILALHYLSETLLLRQPKNTWKSYFMIINLKHVQLLSIKNLVIVKDLDLFSLQQLVMLKELWKA